MITVKMYFGIFIELQKTHFLQFGMLYVSHITFYKNNLAKQLDSKARTNWYRPIRCVHWAVVCHSAPLFNRDLVGIKSLPNLQKATFAFWLNHMDLKSQSSFQFFKLKSKSSKNNFKLISLLVALCKIWEKCM